MRQTDHSRDRFARLHAAADGAGQQQLDTGGAFALESPRETVDGARVVAEREAKARAKREADARQRSLF